MWRRRSRQAESDLAGRHLIDPEIPSRAWKIFDVINARIEHADVKAGAILAACGVISAALIAITTRPGGRDTLLQVFAAASGAFVLMAATFSCGTLWPRRLRRKIPESILYFDHIARRSPAAPEEYEDELRTILADQEAITREIIRQIWATSRVAARKYDFLDHAVRCLFGALMTLGAAALIFALHYTGN
jgi:Family of unknown function (DUF5706)